MPSLPRPSGVRLAVCLLLAAPCLAITPPAREGLAPSAVARLSSPPFVLPQVDPAESKAWAERDAAFRGFVSEGGPWQARWDRRTARLSFASGTFAAWLPAGARVSSDAERAATLADLDGRCRALMARHPGLFPLPSGAAIGLDPIRSVALDRGRVWQVAYAVTLGGVRVEGATIFFRVNSGRLIQMGQEGIADSLAGVPAARVTREAAGLAMAAEVAALLEDPKDARVRLLTEPALAILPWADDPRAYAGVPGDGLQYRLAWRAKAVLEGRLETWEIGLDAVSGETLLLHDVNKYACPAPPQPQGRVVGGVFLGPIEEVPETLRGFSYAAVNHGGPITADVNGIFPFGAAPAATTSLSGSFFDMNCNGCTNPAQAQASISGWGNLTLGFGGNNATGNGLSTKAERNCFYHLNVVRLVAAKHLDDASTGGFLSGNLPANVNIASTCNAFWNGFSVNFFRAGGGCNNTGEIADVMQHEWGHGLDQNTGGGADGARGEGLSDVVAFLSTHDARLGPYFVAGDPAGIRNADENVAGLMTVANVASRCPSVGGGGDGPLGRQVHCEGQIFSQTWWHLARNLRNKMTAAGGGEAAGWFLAEKLFFQSLPLSSTYLPAGPRSTYDAVIAVDDDNGNLADGTPNAAEINDAFGHHGIAPATLAPDTADCVAPAAPVVSLSSASDPGTGLTQVRVAWTAVPGAVEYRIGRNVAGGAGADEPLATVMAPGLEFFDDDVADGVTHYYRVTAFLPNGCTSIIDNRQQITVGAVPSIALTAISFDETGNPGGNANGVIEPGETVVVALSARNNGAGPATAVLAELTTAEPGVTIVRGSELLGDMVAGMQRSTSPPHFAVLLDRARVACGQVLSFVASFTATEGCVTSGFTMQVGAPPQPCEAPDPRPRLRFDASAVADGTADGGSGDGGGFADPGEIIRLPVDLTNIANATATNVRGTLSLVSGPAGTLVSDATTDWADLAPSASGRSTGAPPHVEVTVPGNAPCGAVIDLVLAITYDGPAGSYALDVPLPLLVGRIVEPAVFADDFETGDNGFTHGASCTNPGCDDWQRGAPTTASAWDPAVAHSGVAVWGNDLGTLVAQGSNGDYRRSTTNWLESAPIDCSALTGTRLSYWRWLTVEDGGFDHARVQVNGVTVWENPAGANLLDTAWTFVEHDISALADGNPAVTIRFELEADDGLQFGGWTLDDMRVFTREVVCGSCPAVGQPPGVGPALRATGVKSDTSAEFDWSLVTPPLNAGESWNVYRGTVASDVTTLISPPDFQAQSLADTAAPDALYFYLVTRANCLGNETP